MEICPPTLPLEIIALIVDILASDGVPDLQSVKSCALTCKSVLPFCRRHIFASISLVFMSDCLELFDALAGSPDIAMCVRHLELGESFVEYDGEARADPVTFAHLSQMIDAFTVLESVEVLQLQEGSTKIYWENIRPEMQNLITRLIRAPTLKSLTLRKLGAIPWACLIGLSDKLRHLHLHSVTIDNNDEHTELVPANPIRLERYSINEKSLVATNALLEATYPSGAPIFHFGDLKHLRIYSKRIITHEDFLYKLLAAADQLSTLELEGDSVRMLLRTSILISARQKVPRQVVLCFSDIFGPGTMVDALLALGGNALGAAEELVIYVNGWGWALGELDNCTRTGERIDGLLTDKGVWPHLKAVKLIMHATAWNRLRSDGDNPEGAETLSQSYIRTHFPALSSSESISFNCAINVPGYASGPAHAIRTTTFTLDSGFTSAFHLSDDEPH
ncbi:hypothetical protein HYPSUDRAFT_84743 [Hypholoma sublateritium FD-334 SS-4]|uniref:Uncharacterized protein n=1 Tax=Hypholoma sublateritium (strain FD-334 SS-4) TaxID=945553 RepID=A0A0D2Q491_HYPSF|nr:hypothetical protein HYPSUDRAFT_84743 [Hypholoma sublateritium FD-334 SS-4]